MLVGIKILIFNTLVNWYNSPFFYGIIDEVFNICPCTCSKCSSRIEQALLALLFVWRLHSAMNKLPHMSIYGFFFGGRPHSPSFAFFRVCCKRIFTTFTKRMPFSLRIDFSKNKYLNSIVKFFTEFKIKYSMFLFCGCP